MYKIKVMRGLSSTATGLNTYQIILKEYGKEVRYWQIKAIDALSAINQVCINQRAYQEYTAVKMS